jgi:5'-phosphate synthase pdxT subunit
VSGPKIGVLALQGDVREHVAALQSCGAVAVAVRRPADLEGIRALVLPGGESTTMSLLLRSSGLAGELAARLADGLAVLGTCAGMILLARRVLDGRTDQLCFGAIDLSVRRNAFGRQLESFEAELVVSGIPGGPMHAVFIRAPFVEEVGPKVEVLASVGLDEGDERIALAAAAVVESGGALAAPARTGPARTRPVVCREGRVTVAAFHPELAGDLRLHEQLLRDIEGD